MVFLVHLKHHLIDTIYLAAIHLLRKAECGYEEGRSGAGGRCWLQDTGNWCLLYSSRKERVPSGDRRVSSPLSIPEKPGPSLLSGIRKSQPLSLRLV